jgi:putative NADH-flavin reductase
MHIAVIGSAGRTGRRTVARARAMGATVTGLQRRSGGAAVPGVEVVAGDATDAVVLAKTVRGADLVVCALGATPSAPLDTCSRATRALVDVLRACGPSRLVVVTGAMIGHSPARLPWLYRAMEKAFPTLRALLVERRVQERLVRESGLRWTIVRPPRLSDRPRRGNLAVGEELDVGLFASVSREALADFLVGDGASDALVGRAVAVVER